jgi:hypothetical protein
MVQATHAYDDCSVDRCLWGALLAVRALFDRLGLESPSLREWENHLWAWSSVGPAIFMNWWNSRPSLVGSWPGQKPLPAELLATADAAGLAPEDLQTVVEATALIVYEHLWTIVKHDELLMDLGRVQTVLDRHGLSLPAPEMLPASPFTEAGGWGDHHSAEDVGRIRRTTWDGGA